MRDAGGISETVTSTAQRRCERWSGEQLSQLKALVAEGLAEDEIATRLGRTRRAVRTMQLRLGGPHLREAPQPWTEAECRLAREMHAREASCAEIAAALPGRTELAVFRKLRHLVGAAPFAATRLTRRRPARPKDAEAPEAPPPQAESPALVLPQMGEAPPPPLPVAANQPGAPPWQSLLAQRLLATPASIDAMVRWLRSRDYVVLKTKSGWRVDHHDLMDDHALAEFVNVRRVRLRMPVFILVEAAKDAHAFDIAG